MTKTNERLLTRRDFLKISGQFALAGVTALGLESVLSGCATRPPTAGFNPNFRGPGSQWHTFMRSIYDGWTPGIDWKVSPKTPMVAVASGKVENIHQINMAGHAGGRGVEIGHCIDPSDRIVYKSAYYHLNKVDVAWSDRVERGDIVGYAGDTDTYNVAKLCLRAFGNLVNPDNYGPGYNHMQYWDGDNSLEIRDGWERYLNQCRIMGNLLECYLGKDRKKINVAEHSDGYYGTCNWSLFEKFTYLEHKFEGKPNLFPNLRKHHFELMKKEFYNNQPIVLTLPFKKP